MILRIFDFLSRGEITWKFTTFNRNYRTPESRKTLKLMCSAHDVVLKTTWVSAYLFLCLKENTFTNVFLWAG